MTPVRVQRQRTKGWRMPPNTVCVDRSTKWGNPCRSGPYGVVISDEEKVKRFRALIDNWGGFHSCRQADQGKPLITIADIKRELRGFNLACWCQEESLWCHGDVLLEIANS